MKCKSLNKKIFAFIALGTFLFSAVGCSGGDKKVSSIADMSADTKAAWEEAAKTPFGKYPELVTYTMGKATSPSTRIPADSKYASDNYENNAYTRYIKGLYNIQNKDAFEVSGGDNYNQKVSMTIAGGEIPDVMIVDEPTLRSLVANDMIEDLSEAYKNCASKEVKARYDSYSGKVLEKATFDGKLMAIPDATMDAGPTMLWLREDWMEALGLSEPKTMADIENILTQFVEKDPGKNGAGKTIGLAVNKKVGGYYAAQNMLDNVFSLFGSYPRQWMKNDAGDIVYGSTTPETKKALESITSWYKKGIIDKEFPVRTDDDLRSIIVNGQSGAFFGPWWSGDSPLQDNYKLNQNVKWKAYLVPVDDKGNVKMYTQNMATNYVVVRKGYEHPEVVVKGLNVRCGVNETDTQAVNTDEMKKLAEDVKECDKLGVDGSLYPINIYVDYRDAVARLHKTAQKYLNKEVKLEDISDEYFRSVSQNCEEYLNNIKEGKKPTASVWSTYHSRMVGSPLMESKNIVNIDPVFFGRTESMELKWANLEKQENEMYLKIITGEESIDYFDKFVNSWKSTGGDDITKEISKIVKK